MEAAEGGVGLGMQSQFVWFTFTRGRFGALQGPAAPDSPGSCLRGQQLSVLCWPQPGLPGLECSPKCGNSGRGSSVRECAACSNSAHLSSLTPSLQMLLVQEKTKINAPVLEEMWQNTENETAKLWEKASECTAALGGLLMYCKSQQQYWSALLCRLEFCGGWGWNNLLNVPLSEKCIRAKQVWSWKRHCHISPQFRLEECSGGIKPYLEMWLNLKNCKKMKRLEEILTRNWYASFNI